LWVIFDRFSAGCLLIDLRFAPKAVLDVPTATTSRQARRQA